MNDCRLQPWEQIPFSFHFPYFLVWFLSPEGYIDGYSLDYGSFTPLNEALFKSKIPFSDPLLGGPLVRAQPLLKLLGVS